MRLLPGFQKHPSSFLKEFLDETVAIPPFVDLNEFTPGKQLTLEIVHANGGVDTIKLNHTYNQGQIAWFNEGSALNLIKKQNA